MSFRWRTTKACGRCGALLLNPQRVWEQPDALQGMWNLRDVSKEGGQMMMLVVVPIPVHRQYTSPLRHHAFRHHPHQHQRFRVTGLHHRVLGSKLAQFRYIT